MQQNESLDSPIDIHIQLNNKDLELNEELMFNSFKEENQYQDYKQIDKEYKFGKSIFISGALIGGLSPIAFSASSGICISFGLCLGLICNNVYSYFLFLRN